MYQQLAFVEVNSGSQEKKRNTFKERVNERIARYGVETITDIEILSVLTEIPLEKLESHVAKYGIIELARNFNALDITETQRRKLSMIFEITRKIGSANVKEKEVLDASSKAGKYFVNLLATKPVEEMHVVFLNSQNAVINTFRLSKGTINETAIYIREFVKEAILNNASAVIMAHNHPGESKTPSNADIHTTKNLKSAFEIMGVKLIDHIIVCGNDYISLAERGLL
jgi:DNA repair protein RadC